MMSLNKRLLLAASIVLSAFLGLTGFTLDRLFSESALAAVQDRLEGHVYTLIAATIIGEDKGLHLPDELSFSHPSSVLFAQAMSNDAKKLWRSPSMLDRSALFRWALPPVTNRFEKTSMPDGQKIYVYSLGVTWDQSEDVHDGYTFSVGESEDTYNSQVQNFRKKLWGWLTGVALVLLIVQSVILRWGLSPLRRVEADLQAIESGHCTQLEGTYPEELTGLTNNLNKLITNEREHLVRYRDTLGNLAHSLKTPLAVLRGEMANFAGSESQKQTMDEQVSAMTQIVEYQLQRAATSGRSALSARVNVSKTVSKLTNALNKVYAEKNVQFHNHVDESVMFQGDEGDLMEMLGNIVDNAYKYCDHHVKVRSNVVDDENNPEFVLIVENDGLKIPGEQIESIMQRGVRGDIDAQGHGIGLAIVNDILRVYAGKLEIENSELGGARIIIKIPVKYS